jgi:hypothetical protein
MLARQAPPAEERGDHVGRRERRRPDRYPSLAGFYNADERRIHSRELDVGLWWRESAEGPLHRAAWVQDTGELYVARLGPAEGGGGAVQVLARVAEVEQLEALVAGWRERCGAPKSLFWLRAMAARGRVPMPAVRPDRAALQRAAKRPSLPFSARVSARGA